MREQREIGSLSKSLMKLDVGNDGGDSDVEEAVSGATKRAERKIEKEIDSRPTHSGTAQ